MLPKLVATTCVLVGEQLLLRCLCVEIYVTFKSITPQVRETFRCNTDGKLTLLNTSEKCFFVLFVVCVVSDCYFLFLVTYLFVAMFCFRMETIMR